MWFSLTYSYNIFFNIDFFQACIQSLGASQGMNGCFMLRLTRNNGSRQQQGAFHQLSGAGVQRAAPAHYYINSQIRGGRGRARASSKGDAERWRGLSFSNCRRLNELSGWGENGSSKSLTYLSVSAPIGRTEGLHECRSESMRLIVWLLMDFQAHRGLFPNCAVL